MDKYYYQDEEFEVLEDAEELYYDEDFLEHDTPEEEKKIFGLKGFTIVLVLITIAIAVISYGFRLEEVRIIGNKNYTSSEIKELIGLPEKGGNTLFCYLKYHRYKVDDIPFLEKVEVKMESSAILCINVSETSILACMKDGKKYYYFDDDAIVREVLTERRKTLPVIEGVNAEVLEQGKAISVENRTVFKGMMELSQLLLDNALKTQKIEVDSEGKFTVFVDERIRVGFGSPVLLEEKVAEMANILPELEKIGKTEEIRGILHLENYDSTKNSIVFTKENSN